MLARLRFIVVAALFVVSALAVFRVFMTMTGFWLLIFGVVGVAVFGPWSYYLYAKMRLPQRPTHDEIVEEERMKMKIEEERIKMKMREK